MRIIYLGTPEFAVPALKKLLAWQECQIVGLVTQPDRPAGRGQHLCSPPTKLAVAENNIPVFQPTNISKSQQTIEDLFALKPDVLVTVAFGQILKTNVLTMAPLGVVNLHCSILPKYRGAAPINWAIINGETVTGVTTMLSDIGIDTGPILLKRHVPIDPDTNAIELTHSLSLIGADLLIETLEGLKKGQLQGISQNEAEASYAPQLTKETGKIAWVQPAFAIHNLVRGVMPWPGAQTSYKGIALKIWKSKITEISEHSFEPGSIVETGERIITACGTLGNERIELLEVQPANKAKMGAKDWANGVRLKVGSILENP